MAPNLLPDKKVHLDGLDWNSIYTSLNLQGYAVINQLLANDECDYLISLYENSSFFRKTVNMQQYRFGLGEYKYFNDPLPDKIEALRQQFYCKLQPVANDWANRLNIKTCYPKSLDQFLSLCRANNQGLPTPLLLKYGQGGFNTLHQDSYGKIYFPFQTLTVLSQPGTDFDGGELVFVDHLPRAQSKATVVVANKGDTIVFTSQFRPVKKTKGFSKLKVKHGVSEIKSGKRFSLGIIFHNAEK